MPIAAAVIGGVISSRSSKKAAKSAQRGTDQALNFQREVDERTQKDTQPWIDSGNKANTRLSDIFLNDNAPDYSSFYKSPGYQFRLDEGMRGVSNSASGQAGINSGRTLKALQRYGSDYASGEFNKYIGSLDRLSNAGANMVGVRAGQGQKSAESAGDFARRGAEYQGAADIARGKAINNTIGGISEAFQAGGGSSYTQGGTSYGGYLPGSGYNNTDFRPSYNRQVA